MTTPPLATQRSIDQHFREFHDNNPAVYTELVAMARQLRTRGYHTIGVELLVAAYRWNRMMRTTADAFSFKINNNFTSRYARLIMTQEEDLAGFFQTRTLRTP